VTGGDAPHQPAALLVAKPWCDAVGQATHLTGSGGLEPRSTGSEAERLQAGGQTRDQLRESRPERTLRAAVLAMTESCHCPSAQFSCLARAARSADSGRGHRERDPAG